MRIVLLAAIAAIGVSGVSTAQTASTHCIDASGQVLAINDLELDVRSPGGDGGGSELNRNGQLVVSNIGSSGEDGVRQVRRPGDDGGEGELNRNGQLVVSNIGSSGEDGVRNIGSSGEDGVRSNIGSSGQDGVRSPRQSNAATGQSRRRGGAVVEDTALVGENGRLPACPTG